MKIDKTQGMHLMAAVLLYAAALVYQGYQYGQGDQSQILPCLYAQDHPGAYAQDHYVQHYLQSRVNERTVFHLLFRYLGYQQPWVVFLWHAALGISLILAWIRIAGLGIKNIGYRYLAVSLILFAGFHTSLGGNELYYNSVIPSLVAKALASWSIYYFLKEKYAAWVTLLLIALFMQPLVGFQLFLLTAIALLLNSIIKKRMDRFPWKHALLYLGISLPWMYLLAHNNGGTRNPDLFMEIIEFRLSHHFLASYFGWVHILAGIFFTVVVLRFYKERMLWMMIVIMIGCIIYEMGAELYHQPFFLYTQWWKTTIWLEAFAFVAITASMDKHFAGTRFISVLGLGIPIGILLLVSGYRLSGYFGDKPEYMFPWSTRQSDEVNISEIAGRNTPDDAVFIVPIDFTAFRWYSKRSTYIDYKAMLHQEEFLQEWYDRIQKIYAYSLEEKKSGFDFMAFNNALLEDPSLISVENWKKLGISHIISPSHAIVSLHLVGSNDSYSIYSLR